MKLKNLDFPTKEDDELHKFMDKFENKLIFVMLFFAMIYGFYIMFGKSC